MFEVGKRYPEIADLTRSLEKRLYPISSFLVDNESEVVTKTLWVASSLFEQDHRLPRSPLGGILESTLRAALNTPIYERGLDVSHHQGAINWTRAFEAGYRFVFIKATEGRNWADPRFVENFAGAKKAGLKAGAYHFVWIEKNPREQIQNLKRQLLAAMSGGGFLDFPVALDIEQRIGKDPQVQAKRISDLVHECRVHFDQEPIIYSSRSVWHDYGLGQDNNDSIDAGRFLNDNRVYDCPLWMVDWDQKPDRLFGGWEDWTIWQTGPAQGVPGISGPVDRNVMKKT